MRKNKIFEAISYIAGYKNHYSGNSRFDIRQYISWAHEFETIYAKTNWEDQDYMLAVESFTNEKIMRSLDC